jgi:hypothetical protein
MRRSAAGHLLASATIPARWTPDQALVVAELLDTLRELLWARYGEQLLEARLDRYLTDWDLKAPRCSKKVNDRRNRPIDSVQRSNQAPQHKIREINDDEIPF